MGLTKIGELAAQYGISNRTLRYWDDVGIVKSLRTENGYRYFDDAGIRRIEQIIILRKLRMSIQDIQDIFKSNEPDYVTNVLQRHLEETKHEAEELRTVSFYLRDWLKPLKPRVICQRHLFPLICQLTQQLSDLKIHSKIYSQKG